MPDVGRVTPGKPIWPEQHRDESQRQREQQEQEQKTPDKRKAPGDTRDPPNPPDSGHIDEYV